MDVTPFCWVISVYFQGRILTTRLLGVEQVSAHWRTLSRTKIQWKNWSVSFSLIQTRIESETRALLSYLYGYMLGWWWWWWLCVCVGDWRCGELGTQHRDGHEDHRHGTGVRSQGPATGLLNTHWPQHHHWWTNTLYYEVISSHRRVCLSRGCCGQGNICTDWLRTDAGLLGWS